MNKHSRHHANPNQVGKDPDIERDTVSFLEQDAAKQTGFMGALTRRQGFFFFPLLIGEGVNLHVLSFRYLFSPQKRTGRAFELTLIAVRLAAYLALVFWVFPLGMGFAFIGVQMAVFGVYMGASFAPNHMGMPIIPEGERLDFLNKQVRTSRNIRGRGMSAAMGGLNYQVEHHLFPSMSRPSLARASRMVQEHCASLEVAYTQTTLMQAYGTVVRYMNRVGLSARDPFDCPMAGQYRRP
jgi:fatty acid desaturase